MSGVSWGFPLLWPDMSAAGQPRREVVGEGFEPSKAEPTGLQPVPFDRSGIPPGEAIIATVRGHMAVP
jgi:hypothetical protein